MDNLKIVNIKYDGSDESLFDEKYIITFIYNRVKFKYSEIDMEIKSFENKNTFLDKEFLEKNINKVFSSFKNFKYFENEVDRFIVENKLNQKVFFTSDEMLDEIFQLTYQKQKEHYSSKHETNIPYIVCNIVNNNFICEDQLQRLFLTKVVMNKLSQNNENNF